MELYTLKKMCEILNISRRSIQCYEKAGLMKPTDRNKYGYLLYDEAAVERARFIRFLQELGFSLKEVKEIIDAKEDVIKEALVKKVVELELLEEHLNMLIEKAQEYIER